LLPEGGENPGGSTRYGGVYFCEALWINTGPGDQHAQRIIESDVNQGIGNWSRTDPPFTK